MLGRIFRHDVGQQEAGSGQHQTDGGFAMGDLSRFLIFFHFERGFTHQFPFAAQPGVFLPMISRTAAKTMAKMLAMVRIAIAVE